MRLPTIQGIIKRRILVNFRVEPKVLQNVLPSDFRPKLHAGQAVAGICLIRLEQMRPKFTPEFIGLSSENAAHRIAVLWDDKETGETREGVYISRRDTDSFINAALGGTLFPGEHHKAAFKIEENENRIHFEMKSEDGSVSIELKGNAAFNFPESSAFSSLEEASNFFETGSLGFSVTSDANRLDGLTLCTNEWKVEPLAVDFVQSSFYQDETTFPKNSIEFDHALIMRNIAHEWHNAPSFDLQ
jgi:hypothetical protein